MSFTKELKFSDLTRMLEAVSKTSDAKKRNKFMSEYFDKLKKFRADFIAKNINKDSSILPVLRLILAQEEKERSYNLQGKTLRQLYISALKIGKESSDSLKLLKCSEEDLPGVIGEVMKTRCSDGSGLSIYEVDQTLTSLSDDTKKAAQESQLVTFIKKSNESEQHKWFAKMVLKRRMNLGIGIDKILKFYHPLADPLFKKFQHLSKVVELIETGQGESSLVDVCQVFTPMRAMLSQKFSSDLKKDNLNFSEMYAETKMDGERFQLHMSNKEFRYYSRNLHEYSVGFNELISPHIRFKQVVHSIILDGEMMVYNNEAKRYHTKGEMGNDVKYIDGNKNPKFRPCFVAFDILYLNGRSYLNDSYSKRHQLLAQLFDDIENIFVKTKPVKIRDADHIADLFNTASENGEEGLVIKKADSVYAPGDRNAGWYKIKADYFDGDVVQDFDCVIIGGFYRNSYEKNYFTRYMVGVVEPQKDGSVNVFACGEIVSGITWQERIKLQDTLKPNLVDHTGEKEISFAKGKIFFGERKPDAWIAPDLSVVLECRLNELRKTTKQCTGYTFRFPRIISIRKDKLYDECCTLKEFEEFCKVDDGKVQKVVRRDVKTADIISPSRKRKTVNSRAAITAKFCKLSQDSDVEIVDKILDGKEFCVMSTSPNLPSIKAMKTMLKRHGGTCVEFPRNGMTFALVVGEITNFVRTFINKNVFNVIKAEWVAEKLGENTMYETMPKIRPVFDLIYITEEFRKSLTDFDEFGDSYTNEFRNESDLEILLNSMKANQDRNDFQEIESEIERFGVKSTNFFADVKVKFEGFGNYLMKSAESVFKYHGGETIDHGKADFVVVDKQNIKNFRSLQIKEKVVIDFRWILDSSDSGYKLNFEDYLVK